MFESIAKFFSAESFMPHGTCYLWDKQLITLHVVSDSVIAFSYYSIPVTLAYFVYKRRDLPFPWIMLMFVGFIFACGTTHLMEVWNVWVSNYWAAGIIKGFTAALSVATAIVLVRIIPQALKLRSPAALEAANQQVTSLNEELTKRAVALESTNKELETFSYSVSHDLRAPLRSIGGFTKILLEEHQSNLDEEGRRLLSVIHDNTKNMGKLVDDLLAFSRLSRQDMNSAEFDMEALVQSVWQDLQSQTDARAVFLPKEIPAAYGDRSLLRQVVFNLLHNALKYSRKTERPLVEFGGRTENNQRIYYIKDNGVGFSMEYAHKLFGVFERLHAQEEFEGSGVGLAIVERIVRRHGGRVWAESEPGRGATFFFALPFPGPSHG